MDNLVSVPLRGKYCREFWAVVITRLASPLGFRPLAG